MPQPAIIVAGHAVLRRLADPGDPANWALLDFQRNEAACYIEHVRRGVQLAAADPSAILLLAGGATRREAGPRTEALSYRFIAEYYDWFGAPDVAPRAYLEEFSRDSFENLLFGICRARELTGDWPSVVTLVSWLFKRDRFEMHREAIRWPAERFRFDGPNDPPDLAQAEAAETRARLNYRLDPYSSGEEFRAKRAGRNPFGRHHSYLAGCPELTALLNHQGPALFRDTLPWQKAESP